MFGIDHAGLIAGGQEIVRGQGDIGHVLFAAGAGISDLRTIRNNLEKQADELFSPRGLKPAVNQALTELHKARKLIRDTQLPSSEWQKHKAALDEATGRLAKVEEKLGDLSRRKWRHSACQGRCRRSDGCGSTTRNWSNAAIRPSCRLTLPRTAATRSPAWRRPDRPSRRPPTKSPVSTA